MRNVYDEIISFYDVYEKFSLVLERDIIEGYWRKQAWQGVEATVLKDKWQEIALFFRYLLFLGIESVDDVDEAAYVGYFSWREEYLPKAKVTADIVNTVLNDLRNLADYLLKKKIHCDIEAINAAENKFFKDGQFIYPLSIEEKIIFPDLLNNPESISEELAVQLENMLNRLLKKISIYYRGNVFTDDFNRAVNLYKDPLGNKPKEDNEAFWLGFWDYFLLDYHLIENDLTPLNHFYKVKAKVLSVNERYIVEDLLKTKFIVFYVKRLRDGCTLECVNLLTEEAFEIPVPEYGVDDYKRALLYGHVSKDSMVMFNYITSVNVSVKLRKRIREAILRQEAAFAMQCSAETDTISQFMARHAVLVRHMIDILVNLAKVNVGITNVNRKVAVAPFNNAVNKEIIAVLEALTAKMVFSKFAKSRLITMAADYQYITRNEPKKLSDGLIATAIFTVFALINGVASVDRADLAKKLSLTESEVSAACNDVIAVLQIRIFDPRYLTEEGFVISLYAF